MPIIRFDVNPLPTQDTSRAQIAIIDVRTFVPTDIRSHAIFDRAGHSCLHQMTTPDIRAHIK